MTDLQRGEKKHRWNALTTAQLHAELVQLDEANDALCRENVRLQRELQLAQNHAQFADVHRLSLDLQLRQGNGQPSPATEAQP